MLFGLFSKEKTLKKASKRIKGVLRKMGLKYKQEMKKDEVVFSCDVKYLEQDVLLYIDYNVAFKGSLDVSFMFDKYPWTAQISELLNKYNDDSIYWRAYIDSEGYLCFDCEIPRVCVKDIKYSLQEILDTFTSDDSQKINKEICALKK